MPSGARQVGSVAFGLVRLRYDHASCAAMLVNVGAESRLVAHQHLIVAIMAVRVLGFRLSFTM